MTQDDPGARPRILCIGAYERDNFGDLLFQMVTDTYLADVADVVYAAPFAADMTDLTGLDVPAFGPLLESESFDAVWTVGGEVGGTSVDYAYKAAMGSEVFAEYSDSTLEERRATLASHMGSVHVDSPYLPRPSAYARNVTAASVVNSVGVAAVKRLPAVRKAAVTGILREATFVSVRDRLASDVLSSAGIEHTLEPDLIHSIALTRPRAADSEPGDYILLQISDGHLKKYSLASFAQAIIDSPALAAHPIRLFLAGTAPGHDSVASYQKIIDRVLAADPSRDITVSSSLKPWDRVDEIAGAKLWIGGSLHGRIVSCAYGVPRVSIAKRKLDEYAQTWDPDMPWGITPATLDDAVRAALERGEVDDGGLGDELARRADANIRAAVARVVEHVESARTDEAGELRRVIEARNTQWGELVAGLADEEQKRAAKRSPVAPPTPPAPTPPPSLGARIRRRLRRVARKLRRG